MKRVFWYGLAGIAALLAAAILVPLFLPASVYKDQIESGIERATGRKFTIAGALHLSIFPRLAIQADRIALAGAPDGRAPPIATADDIQLGVQFWPLLSGHVELTRIVLDGPVFAMEVSADGKANWIIEHKNKTTAENSGPHFSITPHFSGIQINKGRFTYANMRTHTHIGFDNIDAAIGLERLDRPATASGSLAWNGRDISFQAKAATPDRLLNARDGDLEVSLASLGSRVNFSGAVTPDGHISGNIKADTASFRDDATWLGAHMPDSGGFGALSLQSTIAGDNESLALTGLSATLDTMHIGGDIRIAKGGLRPLLDGHLSIDRLNINDYIRHRHGSGTSRKAHSAGEWSDEPISLDILRKSDADLTINAGAVTVRNLSLGKTMMRVGLRDGKLDAALFPMSLYGGRGKAALKIDTNGPAPAFHNTLEFDNVALGPFFADTIGVKQIEGTGTIRLDLTSAGYDPSTIMHGLNGQGSIAFRDGRLRGIDFGAVARTALTMLGDTVKPDAFTSYSAVSGSFAVTKGVLTNKDFQLIGPVLKTTGSGTVDIGNRSIDFRILPRADAIIAKQKLSLGVPFRIKGPWKHVRYTADVAGVLQGVLDNLETGKAPFKGLLGPSKPQDPNAPKKKHKNIGDALKNMLGVH